MTLTPADIVRKLQAGGHHELAAEIALEALDYHAQAGTIAPSGELDYLTKRELEALTSDEMTHLRTKQTALYVESIKHLGDEPVAR